MRRLLVSFPILLLLLMSCNGHRSGSAEGDVAGDSTQGDSLSDEKAIPMAADELFDDFIYNFAGNGKLQRLRVAFPLPVEEGGRTTLLDQSQWKVEDFFMRQGYYTLLFDDEQYMEVVKDTAVAHAVVEKILLSSNTVKQYVFDRRNGLWMLTSIHTQPIAMGHHATFLAFYHQFATDKAFQQQHLARTVKFVGPDPDDDFSRMEGIITPDTWEAFAPELPSDLLYNIIYGEPHPEGRTMVFVLRGIANGLELQMTFQRDGDNWKLIKLNT